MIDRVIMNELFPHGVADKPEVGIGTIGNDRHFKKIMDDAVFDPVQVVALVIINEYGQLLVSFNEKRQVWDIPQGVVEDFDNSSEDAIIREIKEEINLDIDKSNFSTIAKFKNINPNFPENFETTLYLLNTVKFQDQNASFITIADIRNNEPDKNKHLSFRAISQMPQPQGLSLRMFLSML